MTLSKNSQRPIFSTDCGSQFSFLFKSWFSLNSIFKAPKYPSIVSFFAVRKRSLKCSQSRTLPKKTKLCSVWVEKKQDISHQWSTRSASPQTRLIDFEVLRRTDGRTVCVKIVIITGLDCGRPRGSTSKGSKNGAKKTNRNAIYNYRSNAS